MVVEQIAERMAWELGRRMRLTLERFCRAELYLVARFVRQRFPSWRKYYGC